MDLNRMYKPFNFKCPHCNKEIELYANDIERQYQKAKADLQEIQRQIGFYKSEYREDFKTNEWYKKARKAFACKQREVARLKEIRKMLQEESEHQYLKAFKDVVRLAVSQETFMKWVEEAEKDIQGNTYDTAIQNSSIILGSNYKE